MILFKKNYLKKIIIFFYKFFNSLISIINYFIFNKANDKIKVFYGGSLTGDIGGTLVKLKKLKKKFANNYIGYNCIYLQSNSIYLNKFAIKFFNKVKIPIIHNQNGVFYEGWYGNGWEKENEKISYQLHKANYVFYQSQFSKDCSDKFLGIRNGPSEILYNAVDTSVFSPNKKKELGSELKILVSGKYQEHLYYSLEFALNILNLLLTNNIKAKIEFAGHYDPEVIKKIFKLANKYKIQENIKFSGVYKQEEAHLIYNSADIYFYFVHQSNCPNSVIEAMSCGLPVLCTNTGGLPEIVSNNTGVCLETKKSWERPFIPNLEDALNGINNIINNYSDYSNNCIIKSAKDHNINNWINKHEEIFNKLK